MGTTQLKVTGMQCEACAQHVARALHGVSGVRSATVFLQTGAATVQHDESANPAMLIDAVATAGYQAHRVWDTDAKA